MSNNNAFRMRPARRPDKELRRVLLAQLDAAHQALDVKQPARTDDPAVHQGVHNARKCCKRLRATVALAASGLDSPRRLDKGFRDAARFIGPLRDDHVMRLTAAKLGIAGPEGPPPDPAQPVLQATRQLTRMRAQVEAVELAGVTADALCAGLERGHQDCRDRLAHAMRTRYSEDVHDLRKAVKAHGYHIALLQSTWPPVLDPYLVRVDELQEVLGDHHDLWVLAHELGHQPDAWVEREEQLQEQALELAGALFAVGSGAFAEVVRSAWASRQR